MTTEKDTVGILSRAIVRELPTSRIESFLKKFEEGARKNSCGHDCNCGLACFVPVEDVAIDRYGHTELSNEALVEVGKNEMDKLRKEIDELMSASNFAFVRQT